MAFSYDPSLASDVDKIRALVPDRKAEEYFFENEELTGFLALESTVRSAAALALEILASDQVMVLKVIRVLDLSTDGVRMSDALLKRAATLRAQDSDAYESDDPGFEIAEQIVTDANYAEKIFKEYQRGTI